jgi:hypothetical protein
MKERMVDDGRMDDKGKARILNGFFRNTNLPTNFYVALVTSAVAPNADTNTLSQLSEVPAGNGYSEGGYQLSRNSTDFDSLVENDSDDRGDLQIKDLVWTAAGGPVPASGTGARYAVLTDDNATVGNREVLAWWDLVSDRTVSAGQTLTLQNCELRLTE